MDDAIEEAARKLHRRRCNSAGIWDETKIAEYWLGCDRSNYRQQARKIEVAVTAEA